MTRQQGPVRPLDEIEHAGLSRSERKRIRRLGGAKRCMDIVCGGLLLLLAAPIFLGVTVAILLSDGRPVIFRQSRLGHREVPFELLKFRTMSPAREGPSTGRDDRQRLTPLGRFLRSTSLDELPQLLSVLRGDMSLVGPRPLFTRYLPHYREIERLRHVVRPGITGLAQVSGRNHLGWDDRLRMDVDYVTNASLRTDLLILWRTLSQVVRRRDVVVIPGELGEPLDSERTYPILDGLTLRRLRTSDLDDRVRWMNDPRTQLHTRIETVTPTSTREWFDRVRQEADRHDLVVIEATGARAVGMAGLIPRGPGTAEFYVFLDPEQHGRGVGRAASRMVCQWAFDRLALDEITLTVHQDNRAACRIYQSLGFQQTATDHGRRSMTLSRERFAATRGPQAPTVPSARIPVG
ncbi:GNAT family N-acetyltransferase [Micromonospora sp. CPCC 205558]|uniref:GNAT family N-acetyltransferase n=1 Tax=Micromonospora sp. CPCC 205558 TaxID=3122403 RepID=UPI002FF2782E